MTSMHVYTIIIWNHQSHIPLSKSIQKQTEWDYRVTTRSKRKVEKSLIDFRSKFLKTTLRKFENYHKKSNYYKTNHHIKTISNIKYKN